VVSLLTQTTVAQLTTTLSSNYNTLLGAATAAKSAYTTPAALQCTLSSANLTAFSNFQYALQTQSSNLTALNATYISANTALKNYNTNFTTKSATYAIWDATAGASINSTQLSYLKAVSSNATAASNAANVNLIQTQIQTASLLAFYVGVFSFGIGFMKLGFIMNLMGPAVISGFQSAAAITIGLGQMKNTFGYGKDFTSSSHLDSLIQSFIDLRGELSTTATWTGWLWVGILLLFKYLGRIPYKVKGVQVFRFFKITGPIVVVIISILATYHQKLYLSPGCTAYDSVKGTSNVFVGATLAAQSCPAANLPVWNTSYSATTTTNFLGQLITYYPPRDNPGCVAMPKTQGASAATAAKGQAYPWPRRRALNIVGTFGNPPSGKTPNFSLVSGQLLTGAIIITLVASLESIAIAKALASKHKQPDLDPSKEYMALGVANFFGSFTQTYPISGSFSRSALNDEVGATSPVAVLTVAVLVGITIKVASRAPIFFYLPQNALSAIVVVALTNLVDVTHFFWLLKYDRKDAGLWLAAFLAVLFQGVEIGILIAVLISLGFVVLEIFMAQLPELGAVPNAKTRRVYRTLSQYPHAERVPGVSIVRVEAPIIFFNAAKVGTRLRSLVYGSDAASVKYNKEVAENKTRAVVVDFSNVSYVDSAFLEMFGDLLASFDSAGVLLVVVNPNTNVLHKLSITPLLDKLNHQFGVDHSWVFLTITDAIEAVRYFEPPVEPVKVYVPADIAAADKLAAAESA
jgi:MFS superfamily sulfate permease-like transporter